MGSTGKKVKENSSYGTELNSIRDKILNELSVTESFSEERAELREQYKKLQNEKDELEARYNALQKELEKEELSIDEDTVKTFGKNSPLLGLFQEYTERGEQLLKESSTILDKIKNIDKQKTAIRDKNDDLDNIQYRTDRVMFGRVADKLPSTKLNLNHLSTEFKIRNIKGFTSDLSQYEKSRFDNGEAYVTLISPKEYLQRTGLEIFKASLERSLRGVDWANVRQYAKEMSNGAKFPIPYLNYETSGQEGRHRALAAILNGYDLIPVVINKKRK